MLSRESLVEIGPRMSEWPGVFSERWPVLVPPLVVSEAAPAILSQMHDAETHMLTHGLEAAHVDRDEALRGVHQALVDDLKRVARSASTPGERVDGQVEVLVAAEAAVREQLAQVDALSVSRQVDLEESVRGWVSRERDLAREGPQYPSRGAQWIEFGAFVAAGLAVALFTLPLVIVPLLAVVAGVVLGGVALWLRRRRWERYEARWKSIPEDMRTVLNAVLRDSQEAVKARLKDARVSILNGLLLRIQNARLQLRSDVRALSAVVSEYEEQRSREQSLQTAQGSAAMPTHGLVVVVDGTDHEKPDAAFAATESDMDQSILQLMDRRAVLDASAMIHKPPRPVTVETLEALVAEVVRSVGGIYSIRHSCEALISAIHTVCSHGWNTSRLSRAATAHAGTHQAEDNATLLVGRAIVEACGDVREDYLGVRRYDLGGGPHVWLQSEFVPIPGLAADTVLAVRIRRFNAGVSS